MIEQLTIPRALIDPEDLRGTTVPFERNGQTFLGKLEEPLTTARGEKVSIIRELRSRDGHIVRWDVVLQGGADPTTGLRFEGLGEELKLRYRSQTRTNEGISTGGKIDWEDIARSWSLPVDDRNPLPSW